MIPRQLEIRAEFWASYPHSGTMRFDFEMRDSIGQTVFSDIEESMGQALKDFADWIYAQLETAYNFQNADAQIDESIEADEYEFDENGAIV